VTQSLHILRAALFATLLVGAVGLSISAAIMDKLPGDVAVTQWLQGYQETWFVDLMRTFSQIGNTGPMLLLMLAAGMVLYARAHRAQALNLAFVALAATMVPVLKETVDRPRPTADAIYVLSEVSGHSFPSGHAFLAITFFGAMFYLAPRLCGAGAKFVLPLRLFLATMILGIGLSRIYLGAHWLSDVIGGFVIGGLALYAAVELFHLAQRRWSGSSRANASLDNLPTPG